jgi:hypothetical protein
MGVDTHMIAGVRACLTFASTDPHPTIQPTPHYAEALVSGELLGEPSAELRAKMADSEVRLFTPYQSM